jgi:hypothetical protein
MLKIVLFAALICALVAMDIAYSRLDKSRDQQRSVFDPRNIIDDLKRKELYVFAGTVIAVFVIGMLLVLVP